MVVISSKQHSSVFLEIKVVTRTTKLILHKTSHHLSTAKSQRPDYGLPEWKTQSHLSFILFNTDKRSILPNCDKHIICITKVKKIYLSPYEKCTHLITNGNVLDEYIISKDFEINTIEIQNILFQDSEYIISSLAQQRDVILYLRK